MQKGFATLEVILMVMVIGILASIAVPRFTAVTTAANTAKIQSDLSTIDTAIAIYIMEKGTPNSTATISITTDLKPYLQDVDNLKPPTGQCYVNGEAKDISGTSYIVKKVDSEYRALLKIGSDEKKAGDFSTTKTSTGSGSGDSDDD